LGLTDVLADIQRAVNRLLRGWFFERVRFR
jgi:hypothetical protein